MSCLRIKTLFETLIVSVISENVEKLTPDLKTLVQMPKAYQKASVALEVLRSFLAFVSLGKGWRHPRTVAGRLHCSTTSAQKAIPV